MSTPNLRGSVKGPAGNETPTVETIDGSGRSVGSSVPRLPDPWLTHVLERRALLLPTCLQKFPWALNAGRGERKAPDVQTPLR